MLKRNLQLLNEVIVGSADPGVAKLLTRLKREGKVVRLAPRHHVGSSVFGARTFQDA